MHPAQQSVDDLLRDCQSRRGRRSGPGGQHRNKVETAVTITHVPTGIQGDASERRSQAQNRTVAIFRLRVNLAVHHRTADPDIRGVTDLWRTRSRSAKIQVSSQHDDFPALLAEALDQLAASDWDDSAAALQLGVSRTQLIRFLKTAPLAFEQLNSHRDKQGKRPLK